MHYEWRQFGDLGDMSCGSQPGIVMVSSWGPLKWNTATTHTWSLGSGSFSPFATPLRNTGLYTEYVCTTSNIVRGVGPLVSFCLRLL